MKKRHGSKKVHDVIIIGGGIAGLSCARRLQDNGESFIMITPEVGGRMLLSKKGDVNYGAYLVTDYYKNFNKYATLTKKISFSDLKFHLGNRDYSFFNKYLFIYMGQLFRFYKTLYRFSREYEKFRENSLIMSQKEALMKNDFLFNLYKQPAKKFVKRHKMEDIVNKVIGQPVYAITFSSIKDGQAFSFFHACLLLNSNMHEFKFDFEKITKGYKKRIINDEIKSIKKEGEVYVLKGNAGRLYFSRKVVVATPIQVSKKLLKLKKMNKVVNAYMYHLEGSIRKEWESKDFQLFSPDHNVCVIARQTDKTFLVYSKKKPNLKRYFKKYKIIYKKSWRQHLLP